MGRTCRVTNPMDMSLSFRLSKLFSSLSLSGPAVVLLVSLMSSSSSSAANAPLLTTFESILRLSREEAMESHQVEIEGVVIDQIRQRDMIVIWNGSRGLALYSQRTNNLLQAGQRVRVEGTTLAQNNVRVVANKIHLLGEVGPMPEPRLATVQELRDHPGSIEWVRTTAVVKQARAVRGRARLLLRDRGALLNANLFRLGKIDLTKYRHGTIEVTGLLVRSLTPQSASVNEIWIAGLAGVKIVTSPISSPFGHTLRTVEEVLPYKNLPRLRTHLRGRVSLTGTNAFSLRDRTGSIPFAPLGEPHLVDGDLIAAVGYLKRGSDGLLLDACVLRQLDLPRSAELVEKVDGLPTDWGSYLPVIRNISDVRALTDQEIAVQPPVRIRAQIVLKDLQRKCFYVYDGSRGISMELGEVPEQARSGSVLMIAGHVAAGRFSPTLSVSRAELVSEEPLPRSLTVSSQGLQVGRYEAEWVNIDGVVRRVRQADARLILTLARTGARFDVILENGTLADAEELIGAKVIVNGVAERILNRAGQVRGSRLLVPSRENIEVARLADSDLLTREPIRIRELLDPAGQQVVTRPFKIEGTVSLIRQGSVFLEDEDASIEALLVRRPGELVVGDRVTAVGYLGLGQLRPLLEDARIERLDAQGELVVANAQSQRILYSDLNGRLVSLTGRLISKYPVQREYSIVLADSTHAFAAVVDMRKVTPELSALREGSVLKVTGICDFTADRNRNPESFRILLRTPEDIQVLQTPPRINNERLVMIVVGMALIIMVSLAWVSFLRRRVERTEKRFTMAFRASPIPVAMVTDDFKFLDVNRSFLNQFAYEREDVIKRSAAELNLFEGTETEESIRRLLDEKNTVRDLESEICSKNGRRLNVLISAEHIELDQQEVLLIQLQDMTERTALMNQLRESQKMEAVGQLAAGVAHDFNNLLTIIRGNSELIKECAEDPAEVVELNGELDDAACRAADLTRQLLAFSRRSVLKPRVFDLNEAVESSRRMVTRLLGETVEVKLDLVDSKPTIEADPGMIDQIIVNLAVNARDAMPKGGCLTISTALVNLSELDVESDPDAVAGDFVVLGVADNGEGMDMDLQKRVFEPFFTTKEVGKGTGLGLSTVYGIMKQHEGWVAVDSELGKGTRFDSFFPAVATADDHTEKPSDVIEQDGGGATVLLVEDEIAVTRMTSRILRGLGFRILSAENGPAARKVWAQHGKSVDLLLTDMVMPGGVSGLDLANEFSADRPDLPIMFVSGYSQDLVNSEGGEQPNRHFLAKPYSRKQLVTLIHQCLEPAEESG
jgi:two-component system, cell cycle sensor histidine kinase and response regulator CckA